MTLQSEADDLYGLLPAEFTARRNERAKAVRAGGDRELADRIRKLPRPRRAAWVLNTLVRGLPAEVDQLVDLGAEIREAQVAPDGEQLRALDHQRRQLTGALTRQARTLAGELGHQVSDELAAEVENTLRAAMADPAGGAALRTGLLVDSFAATGFEPVDLDRVVAVPEAVSVPTPSQTAPPRRRLAVVREPAPAPKKRPEPDARAGRQARQPAAATKKRADPAARARRRAREAHRHAQEALQKARDALDAAILAVDQTAQAHADATEHREQLEAERSSLQERLRVIGGELTRAHRAEEKAQHAQERADHSRSDARRAVRRAEDGVRRTADDEP